MILTLIVTGMLIISVISCVDCDRHPRSDLREFSSILVAIVSAMALICMLFLISIENTFPEHKIAKLQAERDALVYQMDHQLYLGDALGEFNTKIISMRQTRENPWTNWFQGDYIYEVEPIDLN